MKIDLNERDSHSQGIPVIDASAIPQTVDAAVDDWRGRNDELREKSPSSGGGDDPTVWFPRYQAARAIMTDSTTFSWVGPSPMYLLPASEAPPLSNVFRG